MEYVKFGRTGLKVGKLCLGTSNFGNNTDEAESHRILDAAVERGVNLIDTADRYAINQGKGLTEQIIGRWLKDRPGRRDRIILATKLFGPMSDDVNDRGLSAYHIRRACEESLRRLQVDHIDLYMMHHVDRNTGWDEIWQAMEQLVREGKISYVGCSNFAAWHIAAASEAAGRRNFLGLVADQSPYSLVTRTIELEVLPAAEYYGIATIPYSPTDFGLLAGMLAKTDRARSKSRAPKAERLRPQLSRYESLCHELGQQPATVALAWVLRNKRVTAPIIGPRTIGHLDGYFAALDYQLPEETVAELEKIFPGPGGEAPEAYAW